MHEPIYRPEQWVLYQREDGAAGFGKILGASYDGETWTYSIHGPVTDTTYAAATQDEITRYYENGSWIEPQGGHMSGASAYTDNAPTE